MTPQNSPFNSLPHPHLFHENSEGYSRLLSFLADFDWTDPAAGTNPTEQMQNMDAGVKRILGKHELAPERVLDMVLELMAEPTARAAAARYAAAAFCERALGAVLAFKTRFSAGTDSGPVPAALVSVCAFLIKSRVVRVESIYEIVFYLIVSDFLCFNYL